MHRLVGGSRVRRAGYETAQAAGTQHAADFRRQAGAGGVRIEPVEHRAGLGENVAWAELWSPHKAPWEGTLQRRHVRHSLQVALLR